MTLLKACPAVLDADVCIVGGGPAGIAVAVSLLGSGRSVVLLESGTRRETAWARDLNVGAPDPQQRHEPLAENRRRQWGGASAAWGGRCVPLDRIDLEPRDWVPGSGWPLDPRELTDRLARATALCEAGAAAYDGEAAGLRPAGMLPGFDGDLVGDRLERWSPPTRFGAGPGRRLLRDPDTRVVLDATVRHVQLSADGRRVDHLDVVSRAGVASRVVAGTVVLAAGGLENARVLLSSDDVAPGGVGDHAGHLGRHYMTHLSGQAAVARFRPGVEVRAGFERDADGVYLRRRLWLTPDAQKREQVLNGVLCGVRAEAPAAGVAAGHRDPLFSSVALAKLAVSAARAPRALSPAERAAARAHARVVGTSLPRLAPELARTVRGRYLARRRLPMVLPAAVEHGLPLGFQTEHAPHPESRVSLSAERDATGMRRLRVTPYFSRADKESVVVLHRLLARQLAETGTGTLAYDESALRGRLDRFATHTNSAAHHLGTTRMSASPADGVVDPDGRVHGVANLYVTGASVFPTGGHANPTLTIVALALRLGDLLRGDLPSVGA